MPFISLFSSGSLGSLGRLKKFITSQIYSADPYFSNVQVLMHMDGVNGGTSFPDEANHTFSKAGGSPVTTTAFSKFGGASLSTANGTGYIATPGATSMSSPTGDFTLEAWIYPTAFSGNWTIICGQTLPTATSNSIGMELTDTGKLAGYFYSGSTWISTTSTASVPLNAWSHVAYTRTAGSINVWINGVLGASLATSAAVNSVTTPFTIGARGDGGQPFFGYIDEVRYTLGVARYTANFTAPVAAFPGVSLTPVDPYFAKVSLLMHMDGTPGGTLFPDTIGNTVTTVGTGITTSATSKFGQSALFAPGTAGAHLDVSNVTAFGTGDFTIEFWMNPTSVATDLRSMLDNNLAQGETQQWFSLQQNSSNGITLGYNAAQAIVTAANIISVGSWTHIALTRVGTAVRLFANGVIVGTYTIPIANIFGGNTILNIGQQGSGLRYYQGYLDELRITKGVARYTANFTVPTEAFPSQ